MPSVSLANRTLTLGDVELSVLPSELNWASAALTQVRGDSLAQGGTALFIATGRCENTGQRWKDASEQTRSPAGATPPP